MNCRTVSQNPRMRGKSHPFAHPTAPWTDGVLDYSRTLQPVTIGLPSFGKAVKLSLLDVCHRRCTRCFTSDTKLSTLLFRRYLPSKILILGRTYVDFDVDIK